MTPRHGQKEDSRRWAKDNRYNGGKKEGRECSSGKRVPLCWRAMAILLMQRRLCLYTLLPKPLYSVLLLYTYKNNARDRHTCFSAFSLRLLSGFLPSFVFVPCFLSSHFFHFSLKRDACVLSIKFINTRILNPYVKLNTIYCLNTFLY